MRRLLLIPLVLLLLLAGAMLWSGGGAVHPADFTFINRGSIGTLDPNRMSWLQDIRIGYALWEGLFTLDPQTLQPIPGTADRIDISKDKTLYTFHIRENARWTNGDPVTPRDFVFAWRRMLEEPGDYTYLLGYIKGATEYGDAFAKDPTTADFSSVGIEAPDGATFRVTLKHPVTFFPDLCAFPPLFPLHEQSMLQSRHVNQTDKRVWYDKTFTLPPHLIGNGPYRLVSWKLHEKLRLERSAYYWNRDSVKCKTIDQIESDDPQWSFLRYESQDAETKVDWLAEITGEIAAELKEKHRPDLRVFPGFGTYFYSVNCRPKFGDGRINPLSDVRVRQALAMAFDKTPIVETITRMGESPASTYIPRGIFPAYRSPNGLPYDVHRAKQLLADAGYPGGRGFPQISLLFNTGAHHGEVAQNVRRQWLDHLGVNVDLEGVEINTFRQRLHNKDYAIARASWIGDYNDVSTFTDKYLSFSENNDSDWKNPEYDRLCAAAAIETDPAKRLELFTRAETILCDESPIFPVYYYVNAYLFRDNVRGVALNPRNMVMFQSVEVAR